LFSSCSVSGVAGGARSVFSTHWTRRRRNRFVVAGWVVMPERVHLFMGEPLEGTVANAMHGLKLSVTLRRTGRPFPQARYFAFPGFGCGVGL